MTPNATHDLRLDSPGGVVCEVIKPILAEQIGKNPRCSGNPKVSAVSLQSYDCGGPKEATAPTHQPKDHEHHCQQRVARSAITIVRRATAASANKTVVVTAQTSDLAKPLRTAGP